MKAVNLDGTIKTYSSIPKSWGNVVGGFDTLSDSDLESYGFYDVITPSYNYNIQELGSIEWDSNNSVFTYPVENKEFSQSLAEMKAQKIENLKHMYGQELSKTDWIIIRDQELGNTTDSDIASSRAGLRSDCTTHETAINNKTTKAQVADYSLPSFI
tara:strand:- start:1680 stop:2150 length:471 start_codon:yes stop_codon:yes gene_type:complete